MEAPAGVMDVPHHESPEPLKARTQAVDAVEDIVYGSVSHLYLTAPIFSFEDHFTDCFPR